MTNVPSSTDLDRVMWALQAYDSLALGTTGASGPNVAAEFFVPERSAGSIRLVLAIVHDSRNHRDLLEDDRVAFMCSPGNASRWVQGAGTAAPVDDETERERMLTHLTHHAPGAQAFLDARPVVAVGLAVHSMKVVTGPGEPPLVLRFA